MSEKPLTVNPDAGSLRERNPSQKQVWLWRGQKICYQVNGNDPNRPAVVLIHGFGASIGHWRKNMPALAEIARVFAIDLLGFGASAKPQPTEAIAYTFETWGSQVADFCREIVGGAAVLVGNSIGAIVAMQAAILAPELVRKTVLINCSLRLLQEQKQLTLPWHRRKGARFVQWILSNRAIARFFFDRVRQPDTVRKILYQAYKHPEAVTDELVNIIIEPASDPGALAVFMAFIRYSQGPTPEDLLAKLPCEAIVLWGENDPWESIELGREFTKFACVSRFIPIANAGHCPQDEVPDVVNPLLLGILADR